MRIHRVPLVIGAALTSLLLASCGSAGSPSTSSSTKAVAAPSGSPSASSGGGLTVTDVADRTVTFEKKPEKIVLGESRHAFATMILDKEHPLKKVVAWGKDLQKAAPDIYQRLKKVSPEAEKLPTVGNPAKGDLSVETLLTYNPDVYLMTLDMYKASKSNGMLEKLDQAKIKYLVTDFRVDPVKNTKKSMQLMGQVFDREQTADEYLKFYDSKVTPTLSITPAKEKPSVFIWRAPGVKACCSTWKDANFAAIVTATGGKNIADDFLSGQSGDLSPEQIIASQPRDIVATGGAWEKQSIDPKSKTPYVRIGYDTSTEEAKASIRSLASQPGFEHLKAFKEGRVHSVYHQFYDAPFNFVMFQLLAEWEHGKTQGIDPEASWKEFHERFMPFPASGTMWATAGTDK